MKQLIKIKSNQNVQIIIHQSNVTEWLIEINQ